MQVSSARVCWTAAPRRKRALNKREQEEVEATFMVGLLVLLLLLLWLCCCVAACRFCEKSCKDIEALTRHSCTVEERNTVLANATLLFARELDMRFIVCVAVLH